ncbi:hypothetical protein [Bradyrhizobium elkanii]|uniref:hypothetical protein n=1 Tax=Bradyrhizobium elkanii TaxID=29448 RepID=UPI001BADAFC3|nr:hypothetical protein [Bradyrhizobium elkanii]MBR1160611.1 hypothetical protein [Bradyrhizobium elkanii]
MLMTKEKRTTVRTPRRWAIVDLMVVVRLELLTISGAPAQSPANAPQKVEIFDRAKCICDLEVAAEGVRQNSALCPPYLDTHLARKVAKGAASLSIATASRLAPPA